jgi:hypothetical protein
MKYQIGCKSANTHEKYKGALSVSGQSHSPYSSLIWSRPTEDRCKYVSPAPIGESRLDTQKGDKDHERRAGTDRDGGGGPGCVRSERIPANRPGVSNVKRPDECESLHLKVPPSFLILMHRKLFRFVTTSYGILDALAGWGQRWVARVLNSACF